MHTRSTRTRTREHTHTYTNVELCSHRSSRPRFTSYRIREISSFFLLCFVVLCSLVYLFIFSQSFGKTCKARSSSLFFSLVMFCLSCNIRRMIWFLSSSLLSYSDLTFNPYSLLRHFLRDFNLFYYYKLYSIRNS